jgi:hypothetical protein
VIFLFVAIAIAPSARALAATPVYPPVPLPAAVCAFLSGDVRVSGGEIQVLLRGHIQINGASGCALADESVAASVLSTPVQIGQTTALQNGAYAIDATLPAGIGLGSHQLIVDFGDGRAEVVQPIRVVAAFVLGSTTTAAATTAATTASGSSGGTLPRTGRDIAMLVLWGLAMLTAGTLLVVSTWRRFRVTPVRTDSSRHRPEQQIQRVDGAGFVPSHPDRRRR